MKAVVSDAQGIETLRICKVEEPGDPPPGMALVRTRAFSLNFRDLMVAAGKYGKPADQPQVAGSDMAGEVIAVGEGVTSLEPGDRVLNAPITSWLAGTMQPEDFASFLGGNGVPGVFAEKVLLPARALVRFDQLSFVQAATLPIAGLTAWAAVVTHGGLRPGGTALCLGTGGVSVFAAQIARSMGARAILTSSSKEKAARCRELIGEDIQVLNYAQNPDWHEEARALTGGRGVDVVVETVGGESLGKSVQAVCHGGTVSLVGVLAGADSQVSVRHFLMRQVQVKGIFMESVAELRQFVRFVENSALKPLIDKEFRFEEVKDAYRHLQAQRHTGKVVVEMAD